jgi:hypothetical protein
MTQDEIIDMAIQAGASPDENRIWLMYAEEIEAFANLVAAKATAVEREACAKVCDDYDVKYDVNTCDTAEGIALEIRARGEA